MEGAILQVSFHTRFTYSFYLCSFIQCASNTLMHQKRLKFNVELTDAEYIKKVATEYAAGLVWVLRYYYQVIALPFG